MFAIKEGKIGHKNELDGIQFKNLINKIYIKQRTPISERFDLTESSSAKIKN